jgi:hypothetical protein
LFEIIMLAACPHTLLAGGGPQVPALLLPQESPLELHHTRVREKEGGVIRRHQRRRRHLAVPLSDEEVEE